MMKYCAALVVLALSFSASARGGSGALKFARKIGVSWRLDNSGWMSFVEFSPDGGTIASDGPASPDDTTATINLWSFPDGRWIKRMPAQLRVISPDWKYYATDRAISEMESDKPLLPVPDGFAVFAFSPDSRYLAEAASGTNRGGHSIRVIALPSGKQISTFGKRDVQSIALSPDGAALASGYWDMVALWDISTGRRLATLRGLGRYVQSLSFSSDGALLAAGTDAGSLEIWDVAHRTRLHSIAIQGGQVSNAAFSPGGRFVAIGVYGTGAVWLIDVRSGKIIDHQKVSDLGCGSVAFSPDGRYLITPSTGGLIKWPYDRGGTVRVFEVQARE